VITLSSWRHTNWSREQTEVYCCSICCTSTGISTFCFPGSCSNDNSTTVQVVIWVQEERKNIGKYKWDFYFHATPSLVVLTFPQPLNFSSLLPKLLSHTLTNGRTEGCRRVKGLNRHRDRHHDRNVLASGATVGPGPVGTPLIHNLSREAFDHYQLTSGMLYKGTVTPMQPMIGRDGACVGTTGS
jgi:hypothetical protein